MSEHESPELFPHEVEQPEFDLEAEMEKWERATLDDVVTSDYLLMLSEASGGFRFRPDVKLALQTLQTGRMQTGYTDLKTQYIYFNPLMRVGAPALGIKPWRKVDIRGFATHEAGHHAPPVVIFQNALFKNLNNLSIVPESYRGNPQTEAQFFQALHSHLHNALADIWLESYMGRRPYLPVRADIKDFQTDKGPMQDLRGLTKPEQLVQALLASRYREDPEILEQIGSRAIDRHILELKSLVKDKVDPEVFDTYCRLIDAGAMRTMMNREDFENYFSSDKARQQAIDRKVTSYREAFLPEYLRLMQRELEERKKKKQEQKQNAGAKPGQGGGQGAGQSGNQGGVPLTKEEIQELIEEILKQLQAAGEELESGAPSNEEAQQLQQVMSQIQQALQARHEALKSGQAAPRMPNPTEQEGPTGEEALRQLARELQRADRDRARQGLAEKYGVSPESIRVWQQIREKYRLDIESTASVLAEIFLDDRRKRLEYLRRSGEIVPGLEYETITAFLSGDTDPDTRMDVVRNLEFLEVEMEIAVDRSGSMSGEKLDRSKELLVVIEESFEKVRADLAAEDLIAPIDDQPFRLGVTAFETEPDRITTLDEPLEDGKKLRIIEKLSKAGGGTEETGTIQGIVEGLKLRKSNVLKFITVLTDGHGNRAGLAPIMRNIEEDDEVIFLVVGLGDDSSAAQAIVDSYLGPLQDRQKNVFAIAATDPAQVLPEVLEFYKREVEKRRGNY